MLYQLVIAYVFSHGVVFIDFALAMLMIKQKHRIHYLGAALMGDFGLMCVAGGICTYKHFIGTVDNIAVFVPMILLAPIGSTFALECFAAKGVEQSIEKAIHGGTVALMALCLALKASGSPWRTVFTIVYGWLFAVYLAIVIREGYALKPIRSMPRWLRRFYSLICFAVLLIGGMFACQPFDFYKGMVIFWVLLILSILLVALIAFRSPETYKLIESDASRIRYERPRLSKSRAEQAKARLRETMESKSPYRNPDLTLALLAEEISMSEAELSELLNLYLRVNFNVYVNEHRIEYAKGKLERDSDASILDIAFECGFNSKSTFNGAFKKALGVSPSEYRRQRS